MYKAVQGCLHQYKSEWEAREAFKAYKESLDKKIVELGTIQKKKSKSKPKGGGRKSASKASLALIASINGGELIAYAIKNNLPEVAEQVISSPSELKKFKDDELVYYAETLLALLEEHKDGLAPIGLGDAEIKGLTDVYVEFADVNGIPRQQTTSQSTATTLLGTKYREIDNLLKKGIDLLMNRYKLTSIEFYTKYKGARKIVGG